MSLWATPSTMMSPGLYSSKTPEWATPQWLFDGLNEEFGPFTLDLHEPSLWTGDREVGQESLRVCSARGSGRLSSPGSDGHSLVPRLLLER